MRPIDSALRPFADALSAWVFVSVPVGESQVPLVVLWLVSGAVYFSLRFRFVNVWGLRHGLALALGRGEHGRTAGRPDDHGEVSHFQALSTAVSGTVGIGNIGGVAVAISVGGPGAGFWMLVAGLLGMATKFVECSLGVLYRRHHDDGSVSGGPMYYLHDGLAERGWPRVGRALGVFYAVGIVVGCLGIGNMFQSNQAFAQIVGVTGGPEGWLAEKGWAVGAVLAVLVGAVILGGIRSIARVTARLVPFMGALYLSGAWLVIALNAEALPWALTTMVRDAFRADAVAGGALGAVIVGFQRALFSNEAGLGSATIAHAAARTSEPLTQGFVALLEPFLDTLVICAATALVVITTSYYVPGFTDGLGGIEMTSAAFERRLSWAPYPLALAATLFALSTMVSWSYYGLKGWTYLFGEGTGAARLFKTVFCVAIVVGSSTRLDAVLDFSDALIFLICVPNLLGLYVLAPVVERELAGYRQRARAGSTRD